MMTLFKPLEQKIKSVTSIADDFLPLRATYPLVTTNGCFDLLHIGHLQNLLTGAGLSPYLVVLLNSDVSVKQLKGSNRPIQTEHDRALILASLSVVWRVAIFNEPTPVRALEILKPNIHVKGAEYEHQEIPEKHLIPKWGGKLVFAPELPNKRTSLLINQL